ncbi:MAG: hypothetical protein H7A23_07355 [Leptospiraceae bacterium]|nr:hypothetical protein [Leptospiraceae bacterium]MCP5494357.1 hypothetical protein [Leptospiraceae bacterium]
MELLALVIFNIVFGVFLYFVISIKVTNSVRDYQISKLKKEIYNHTLTFYKESENYLTLMDSKITVLKNLIQKAEKVASLLEDEKLNKFNHILESQNATPTTNLEKKVMQPELVTMETKPSNEISNKLQELKEYLATRNQKTKEPANKEEVQAKTENIIKPATPITKVKSPDKIKVTIMKKDDGDNPIFMNIFGGVGKAFKSMFGLQELYLPQEDEDDSFVSTPSIVVKKQVNKKTVDLSIGGDPFSVVEKQTAVTNNLQMKPKDNQFQVLLNDKYSVKKESDEIKISPTLALSELPADASKVEKVIHLLRKGFNHYEISEELGYSIPEIALIETIRMERSRR